MAGGQSWASWAEVPQALGDGRRLLFWTGVGARVGARVGAWVGAWVGRTSVAALRQHIESSLNLFLFPLIHHLLSFECRFPVCSLFFSALCCRSPRFGQRQCLLLKVHPRVEEVVELDMAAVHLGARLVHRLDVAQAHIIVPCSLHRTEPGSLLALLFSALFGLVCAASQEHVFTSARGQVSEVWVLCGDAERLSSSGEPEPGAVVHT
mmetsp:Transcript_39435/g.77586  ORF Transcript_39435/g.77586 Transcript_39435/m.77586 type:complete len:208 (-) Transcript_39435:16-639(-)